MTIAGEGSLKTWERLGSSAQVGALASIQRDADLQGEGRVGRGPFD